MLINLLKKKLKIMRKKKKKRRTKRKMKIKKRENKKRKRMKIRNKKIRIRKKRIMNNTNKHIKITIIKKMELKKKMRYTLTCLIQLISMLRLQILKQSKMFKILHLRKDILKLLLM
jgi:hypothetical protein